MFGKVAIVWHTSCRCKASPEACAVPERRGAARSPAQRDKGWGEKQGGERKKNVAAPIDCLSMHHGIWCIQISRAFLFILFHFFSPDVPVFGGLLFRIHSRAELGRLSGGPPTLQCPMATWGNITPPNPQTAWPTEEVQLKGLRMTECSSGHLPT